PATSSKPRRQKRKTAKRRQAKANAEPTDGPRQRALAALKANPDAPLTTVAKLAGCARSTVVNARDDLAKEARKQARKPRATPATSAALAKQDERRERAQQWLRQQLADGPQRVSDIEAAAQKAHLDQDALERARAALGIVPSRANAGNTLSVQWSLPG